MGEMIKTSESICRSCIYSSTKDKDAEVTCAYIVFTGQRRNCKVGECDKYKKGCRRKSVFGYV